MPELESKDILEQAKQLLEAGRWQDAVSELDRALQAHPESLALWREKANTLVALQQQQDALDCYQRMLEIDSRDPSIYAEKAEVLESLDRDDEALECYEQALSIAPSSVDVLKAMALLLTRLGETSEAISIYDRILLLRPDDPEFLIAKGDALISAGQVGEAAALFEHAARLNPNAFGAREWASRADTLRDADENDKTIEFYDRAIAADENYAWAYRGKALALREIPEKNREALKLFDTAIHLDPKNAWFCLEKGNLYYDLKEFELAAASYAKATEVDPKYRVAWVNLSIARQAQERWDQALIAAEQSIELDPNSADGWLHKAFCLASLGSEEEAIASDRKALDLEPDNFSVNTHLGWVLSKLKRHEEALPFYQKAIDIDPKDESSYRYKADSLLKLDRREDALDILNQGLEVVGERAPLLGALGYAYTDFLNEHGKALEYYMQCRALAPDNVTVSSDIAECLIKMGRFAEGRAEAERLVGRLLTPERECAMSLVILASYALEGDVNGRARQFDSVLEQIKIYCPGGKGKEKDEGWNFGGLVNVIRASDISAESKFLVLTAIDVQQGNLARGDLLFFSPAKPLAAETAHMS